MTKHIYTPDFRTYSQYDARKKIHCEGTTDPTEIVDATEIVDVVNPMS